MRIKSVSFANPITSALLVSTLFLQRPVRLSITIPYVSTARRHANLDTTRQVTVFITATSSVLCVTHALTAPMFYNLALE